MSVRLAVRGRLEELGDDARRRLLERGREADPEVTATVSELVADVRSRGDAALVDAARRYDGVDLETLEVPRRRWRDALEELDGDLLAALRQAAGAIEAFHRQQLPGVLEHRPRPGLRLGRRPEPLGRVGAYAPGGRAAYPSSVLMTVVPARVAGVDEVVVCSPPAPGGLAHPLVMAACEIAGADRLFVAGGAPAIAALALGTASIPRVDKVVGPGNVWVTEAKRQLAGTVASDCLAGPSEILVIADDGADADLAALELVAQAEHDPDACAVLVTTRAATADAVARRLDALLDDHPRRDLVATALERHGALLVATDVESALAFAADYAPEHLLLLVARPDELLSRVRHAGAVFLGPGSSVAFGDYLSGTNHVLPTAGRCRAESGLSTAEFLRWSSFQEVDAAAAAALAGPTAVLAEAEGLPGHAAAARARWPAPGTVEQDAGAPRPAPEPRGAPHDAAPPAPELEEAPRRAASLPPAPGPSPPGAGTAPRQAAHLPPLPVRRRRGYEHVGHYDPGRRPVEIDLSDNTNLLGPPEAARRALAAATPEALSRYPSVWAGELKAAVGTLHGVDPGTVTTGCGSDDLIDSAIRAFCEPGEVLAYPEPTFSMVPTFAHMNGVRPAAVALGPGWELQVEALLAARPRIVYVCRPNNPTGTLFDRGAVQALAGALDDGILLVDEAYAEFADDDLLDWAAASERAVVLRTLSKAWGLAGLRVGYAVGPPAVIAEIERSRGPYKVGAVAEAVAVATLTEGVAHAAGLVEAVHQGRERLAAELAVLGLRTWPSAANFLLIEAPGGDAAACVAALRARGIGVRGFPALPGAGDCIRATVGPWPLMERFLGALREVVGR